VQRLESQPKSHIVVEEWVNRECEEPLVDELHKSYDELRKLLPGLPAYLRIYFDTRIFNEGVAVTGYAKSADSIGVCINPAFQDKEQQLKEIKPFVFHEGFHMADGFHYDAGKFSGVDAAIAEGKAVVFEMTRAGSDPYYANWQDEAEKVQSWYESLASISAEQYFEESGETWRKWAFFDSETGETSKVYKVGTWMIEQLVTAKAIDIEELCGTPSAVILEWFEEVKERSI